MYLVVTAAISDNPSFDQCSTAAIQRCETTGAALLFQRESAFGMACLFCTGAHGLIDALIPG
jgi:hypothetical protein